MSSPVVFTSDYQGLITSEHNQQPNFMDWVAACTQPFVDIINLIAEMPELFDIDLAVGDQLDKLAQFVGQLRNITVPLVGVYFAFGSDGVGWGEGAWFAPGSSVDGLTTLYDDAFRTLLYAVIARNYWDGTIPGAYSIWQTILAPLGGQIFIVDNQDTTIAFVFSFTTINAVLLSLISNGFLDMVPAGVGVVGYFQPSLPLIDTPMFGFGIESSIISGFGVGAWIEPIEISGTSLGVGGILVTQPNISGGGFITKKLY